MDSLFNLNTSKNGDSKSVMKQAEQIWSMLDDMLETDQESYKKFIENTIKEGKEAIKQSNPEAKKCVKANLANGSVLYVNIFAWSKVPAPENDSKPIPIYGKPIESSSKNSSIVNIVLNPSIFENIDLKPTILNLAFDYIEGQNQVEIDRDNIEVLEAKYFGDLDEIVRTLTVGQKAKSNETEFGQLEESDLPENLLNKLASLGSNETGKDSGKSQLNSAPKIPVYEEKISSNQQATFKIYLPMIDSFNQCDLKVDSAKKCIVLDTTKKEIYKQLVIPLSKLEDSYRVDFNQVEAKFVKKERFLRVKVKIDLINKN